MVFVSCWAILHIYFRMPLYDLLLCRVIHCPPLLELFVNTETLRSQDISDCFPLCFASISDRGWNNRTDNPTCRETSRQQIHDDVIKWKHFPRYWPFVRGIHWSPVNSSHKGQRRGALMFSLICAWINGWVNNREAGDLRRQLAHYDVIVMLEREATCIVLGGYHYSGGIMSAMASLITGVSIVFSTVCSAADQRKHQSSAALAFVRGIHR